ncbi:MAG: hypothetical protein JWO43_215 [Candidatus Adlerbacteria bacterium]|nr:hypothetical protein [Candidatus Adlerbacteria bacterium]
MTRGLYFLLGLALVFNVCAPVAQAQDVVTETITYVKAVVVSIDETRQGTVPGTETAAVYQTITAKLLEGPNAGSEIHIVNDYLVLAKGDMFYARHLVDTLDDIDAYTMGEPYRIPTLGILAAIFAICLVFFGGRQGLRGFIALLLSLACINYLLLPGILAGHSPVLISMGVCALIILVGSYITHGYNRTTTTAVAGMIVTIMVTGALAYWATMQSHLSGFVGDETVYLHFNTNGTIDLVGIVLGGMLIGLLGVLYDAAISQAIAVEELMRAGKHLTRREVYLRAVRIGREHIGALVNTLAIAYVGASLPLFLIYKQTVSQSIVTTINQELFATELLRIMIGSIGVILAVPITTAIAVWWLHGHTLDVSTHGHKH